jgi:O-antigen/teichoic acid export membrane protein
MVAFAMFLLIALSSPLISSFLQISSNGSIILFGVGLLFAMVIPVPWGGLQGLQRFGSLALNLILNGGIKLGSGILFVLFGLGVSGALGAIALSYFLTTLLSVFMLGTYLPKEKIEPSHRPNLQRYDWSYFSEVYPYFLPVGVTLLCFMVLTNIDLILVKHFFTPMEAGYYSIAQMVGKIILFLPVPVVMVMFPKLSSLLGQEKKALLILRQSLMIAVFLCGIALTLGLLFPALIIKILTGKIYEECIPLIRFFCLNMTFFSLAFILLYYHLSTQTRSFLYPLVFFTLTQIGLILFFHRSLSQVLWVVAIVGFCLLGTNLFLIYQAHLNRR